MDSFTAVSADNIDFLHSHARHFKGSKNNSWHGTTIQVVQPLPSLSIHSEGTQQVQESQASLTNDNSVPCSSSVQPTTPTNLLYMHRQVVQQLYVTKQTPWTRRKLSHRKNPYHLLKYAEDLLVNVLML